MLIEQYLIIIGDPYIVLKKKSIRKWGIFSLIYSLICIDLIFDLLLVCRIYRRRRLKELRETW